MSVAEFREYQTVDSGWIDRIPAHWSISPLKRLVQAVSVKRPIIQSDRYLGLERTLALGRERFLASKNNPAPKGWARSFVPVMCFLGSSAPISRK